MTASAHTHVPADAFQRWTATAVFALAVAIPSLLAFNLPPSATVINQIAAAALWGFVLFALAPGKGRALAGLCQTGWLTASLLVIAATVGVSVLGGRLPASLALSSIAFIVVSLAVAWHGASASPGTALRAFFVAWLIVGLASACIALVQVFQPGWADGEWIARSGLPGRAVGNVRQPNHLSGLLLLSAVAVVPWLNARPKAWPWLGALLIVIVFAIELSASRTGLIGVVLLAVWGLVDRRLSRATRLLLCATPVVYAIGWAGMSLWAADTHHTFGAAARLHENDLSSSRAKIWENTLTLIRMVPWTGVGWGEFNYAWSLTPMQPRPPAFFDHTHNLGLQLIVELGIPLGGLVIVLLLVALWQAFRRSMAAEGELGVLKRSAFVGVLLMCIHSAVEYPLWYAYFLLPTAWAWGFCLGGGEGKALAAEGGEKAGTPLMSSMLRVAGLMMLAISLFAFFDYLRVSRIFEPGDEAKPLEQRIAEGQRSVFFAYHADYAAVTVAEHPSDAWPAFAGATHYLLDTRLMIAWATAFAERGDLEHARNIAQRLREFNNPASAEFFAPCDHPKPGTTPPWQCQPPARVMDWRDFLSVKY